MDAVQSEVAVRHLLSKISMFLGEEFKYSINMEKKQSSGRKSNLSLFLLACKLQESSSITYLSKLGKDLQNTMCHTARTALSRGPQMTSVMCVSAFTSRKRNIDTSRRYAMDDNREQYSLCLSLSPHCRASVP